METPSRRWFLCLAATAAALPGASLLAFAQTYPAQPVHLISALRPTWCKWPIGAWRPR
jgi:hypothetical protein